MAARPRTPRAIPLSSHPHPIPAYQAQLDEVLETWDDFHSHLRPVEAPALQAEAPLILTKLDAVVSAFETHARDKVARLRTIQIIFLAAALLLLGWGYLMIRHRIIQPLTILGETARRLGRGNLRQPVPAMGDSVHTTARVTLVTEVDATEFVTMRQRLKASVAEEWGFAPGYNDLLAIIVAKALRQHPYMNARLAPDAIEYLAHVNLGMAVDTERGLLVPNIKDADTKSLRQFGTEFRELAGKARSGRVQPDAISDGTFTITSLGPFDIDAFTPVINLPEAAILGVGRIAPKPAVLDGEIVARQMWTLSLVFDHRIIDGAPAARFLQYIKHVIEEPYLLLAI